MTSADDYDAKMAAMRKARIRKIRSTLTIVDDKKGVIEHGTLNKDATRIKGRKENITIPEAVRKKLFD